MILTKNSYQVISTINLILKDREHTIENILLDKEKKNDYAVVKRENKVARSSIIQTKFTEKDTNY